MTWVSCEALERMDAKPVDEENVDSPETRRVLNGLLATLGDKFEARAEASIKNGVTFKPMEWASKTS